MERSAIDDDVKVCPNCLTKSELVIGWFLEDESTSNEYTRVGCKKCDTYFTEKESKHAVALWNNFARKEFENKGKALNHAEFYKLFYEKTVLEINVNKVQKDIDIYLESHISCKCKFEIGDIIADKRRMNSAWMVKKIYSVYGWNTGPFWIIEAGNISTNGKLTGSRCDFWERDKDYLFKESPYWQPTRWLQIKPNLECLHKNIIGKVISVDHSKRQALIEVGAEKIKIQSLNDIKISILNINKT